MTAFEPAPARHSAALAIAAAGVATALSGPAGAPIGFTGLLLVAAGVVRGWRRAVTLGALLLLGGVVAAGLESASAPALLVGTAATVLAWDLGEQAVNVGEHLGRVATTRRLEAVHAATSGLVAVGGIAVGYGLFLAATGRQPVPALVVLLAAGLALAAALRD